MATYVQGYKMYDREPTPFVPDYKFLSNVLDTRQTRYDQNYKAINDAYSKVVYADLSRAENQETRDQFAKQIAPKMAQISGYDLSLRQNADMATGVFAPFYEDDNVVRDLTNTANYKFGLRYAESLSTSPDKDQRDLYWDTGVKDLNIQMEKYLQADQASALNMSIGNYTPNPNLYEYALKLLDEQGFNVEKDILEPNGRWKITQKNGDLVTEQAYAYLNRALMDDPRVMQGYQVKSRVDSYEFAKQKIESGEVQSIAQGEELWARSKIDEIATQQAILLGSKKAEAEKIGDTAARWEEYTSKYNFPEGHSSYKTASNWKQKYLAATMGVEDTRNLVNLGINSGESANQDLMNKAYLMYMGVNIQDDLGAAAKSYSMKDYSFKLTENKYGLETYKAELKSALQREKFILDKRLADYEKEINQVGPNQDFLITDDKPGNVKYEITDDGTVKSTANTIQNNNTARKAFLSGIKDEQVDFVLSHHQFSEAYKDNPNPHTLTIDGNDYSLTEAREFLSKPANSRHLETLYTTAADNLEDQNAYPTGDMSDADQQKLKNLRHAPKDILKKINRNTALNQLEVETAWNNYSGLLSMKESYGKDLFNLRTQGVPNIFGGDTRGSEGASGKNATSILSREEYRAEYNKWADAKGLHRGSTGGPLIGGAPVSTPAGYIGMSPSLINPSFIAEATRGIYNFFAGEENQVPTVRKSFDVKKSTKIADENYDEQIKYINATMNGAIDLHRNDKGDENFESPFKRFSYIEGSVGIGQDQMTGASALLQQGYKSQFNPLTTQPGDPAYTDFKVLIDQINDGRGVIAIAPGNIMGQDNFDGENNDESQQMLMSLASAVTKYFNAPRDSRGNVKTTGLGKAPFFDIQYNPIMGGAKDEEKNSGYTISVSPEWHSEYLKQNGFENDEIKELLQDDNAGTISIVVDKRLDFNRKSMNNMQAAVSDVNAAISLSDNNYYEYDGGNEGGYLRVYKDGAQFFYEFQGKTFNSTTGEFEVSQKGSGIPLVDPNGTPVTLNQLDGYVNGLELDMDNIVLRNNKLQRAYLESIATKSPYYKTLNSINFPDQNNFKK